MAGENGAPPDVADILGEDTAPAPTPRRLRVGPTSPALVAAPPVDDILGLEFVPSQPPPTPPGAAAQIRDVFSQPPSLTSEEAAPSIEGRARQYLHDKAQRDAYESAMSAVSEPQMSADDSTIASRGLNTGRRLFSRVGHNLMAMPDAVVDQLATSVDDLALRSMGRPRNKTVGEDLKPAGAALLGLTPPALMYQAFEAAQPIVRARTTADLVDAAGDVATIPAAAAVAYGGKRLFGKARRLANVPPPDVPAIGAGARVEPPPAPELGPTRADAPKRMIKDPYGPGYIDEGAVNAALDAWFSDQPAAPQTVTPGDLAAAMELSRLAGAEQQGVRPVPLGGASQPVAPTPRTSPAGWYATPELPAPPPLRGSPLAWDVPANYSPDAPAGPVQSADIHAPARPPIAHQPGGAPPPVVDPPAYYSRGDLPAPDPLVGPAGVGQEVYQVPPRPPVSKAPPNRPVEPPRPSESFAPAAPAPAPATPPAPPPAPQPGSYQSAAPVPRSRMMDPAPRPNEIHLAPESMTALSAQIARMLLDSGRELPESLRREAGMGRPDPVANTSPAVPAVEPIEVPPAPATMRPPYLRKNARPATRGNDVSASEVLRDAEAPNRQEQPAAMPAASASVPSGDTAFPAWFESPAAKQTPAKPITLERLRRVGELTGNQPPTGELTEAQAASWMEATRQEVVAKSGGKDLMPSRNLLIREPRLPVSGIGGYSKISDPQALGNKLKPFAQGLQDVTTEGMNYQHDVIKYLSEGHTKLTPRQHQALFHAINGDAIPEDVAIVKAGKLEPVADRFRNLATQAASDPRLHLSGLQEDYITHAGLRRNSMEQLLEDFQRGDVQRKFNPSLELRRTERTLPRELTKDVNVYQLGAWYARQVYQDAAVNPYVKAVNRLLYGDGGSPTFPREIVDTAWDAKARKYVPVGEPRPSFAQRFPTDAATLDSMAKRVFGMSNDALDAAVHSTLRWAFNDTRVAKAMGITPENAVNGTGVFRWLGKIPWAGPKAMETYVKALTTQTPTATPTRLGRQFAALWGVGLNPGSVTTHLVSDLASALTHNTPLEVARGFYEGVIKRDPALRERMRRMGVLEDTHLMEEMEQTLGREPGSWDRLVRLGGKPIAFTDQVFKTIVYSAAERESLRLGMSPEQAMLTARDWVVSTQNAFGPANTQNWMAAKSVAPFTMFARTPLRFFRIPVDALARGKPAELAKFGGILGGIYAAGKLFNLNLMPKMFHPPASRGINAPPIQMPIDFAQAVYRYATGTPEREGDKFNEERAFRDMLPSAARRFRQWQVGDKDAVEALGFTWEAQPGFSPEAIQGDVEATLHHGPAQGHGKRRLFKRR